MKAKKIILITSLTFASIAGFVAYLNSSNDNNDKLKKEIVIKNDSIKQKAIDFSKFIIETAQNNDSEDFSRKLKIDNILGEGVHNYANKLTSSKEVIAVKRSDVVKDYFYVYYKAEGKIYKFQLSNASNKWQLLNIVKVNKVS